jgi:hypothetical protein
MTLPSLLELFSGRVQAVTFQNAPAGDRMPDTPKPKITLVVDVSCAVKELDEVVAFLEEVGYGVSLQVASDSQSDMTN